MRLCRPAVMALLAWYLMLPPVSNKRVLPDAPLSQWINFGTFESSESCAERLSQLRQNSDQVATMKTMGLDATRILHERNGYAFCIASDDPRLKDSSK